MATSLQAIEKHQAAQVSLSKNIMQQQGEEILEEESTSSITFVDTKEKILGTDDDLPAKLKKTLTYYSLISREGNPVADGRLVVKEDSMQELIKNLAENEKKLCKMSENN